MRFNGHGVYSVSHIKCKVSFSREQEFMRLQLYHILYLKCGERGCRGRSITTGPFPITIPVLFYYIGLCTIAINRPSHEERLLLCGCWEVFESGQRKQAISRVQVVIGLQVAEQVVFLAKTELKIEERKEKRRKRKESGTRR